MTIFEWPKDTEQSMVDFGKIVKPLQDRIAELEVEIERLKKDKERK